MKAYPLIYSRTKYFDSVPDFLTRPKDLNYQLALKYVKNAMSNLDFVQNIRYTAFAVDSYCICGGIACLSEKLFDKLKQLSPELAMNYTDATDYLRDVNGRPVACFIGIAIPRSEVRNGMIPDISLEKYWEVYFKYLKNQWFNTTNTSSEQLEFPLIDDINEKPYVSSFVPQKETFGSRSVIRNYISNEQQVLDYFFHVILSGRDESFITEIKHRMEWDALSFKTVAVSEELYSALKANPVSTLETRSSLLGNTTKTKNTGEVLIKKTPVPEPAPTPDSKKKPTNCSVVLLIAVIIILIVVIAVLMIRKRR